MIIITVIAIVISYHYDNHYCDYDYHYDYYYCDYCYYYGYDYYDYRYCYKLTNITQN